MVIKSPTAQASSGKQDAHSLYSAFIGPSQAPPYALSEVTGDSYMLDKSISGMIPTHSTEEKTGVSWLLRDLSPTTPHRKSTDSGRRADVSTTKAHTSPFANAGVFVDQLQPPGLPLSVNAPTNTGQYTALGNALGQKPSPTSTSHREAIMHMGPFHVPGPDARSLLVTAKQGFSGTAPPSSSNFSTSPFTASATLPFQGLAAASPTSQMPEDRPYVHEQASSGETYHSAQAASTLQRASLGLEAVTKCSYTYGVGSQIPSGEGAEESLTQGSFGEVSQGPLGGSLWGSGTPRGLAASRQRSQSLPNVLTFDQVTSAPWTTVEDPIKGPFSTLGTGPHTGAQTPQQAGVGMGVNGVSFPAGSGDEQSAMLEQLVQLQQSSPDVYGQLVQELLLMQQQQQSAATLPVIPGGSAQVSNNPALASVHIGTSSVPVPGLLQGLTGNVPGIVPQTPAVNPVALQLLLLQQQQQAAAAAVLTDPYTALLATGGAMGAPGALAGVTGSPLLPSHPALGSIPSQQDPAVSELLLKLLALKLDPAANKPLQGLGRGPGGRGKGSRAATTPSSPTMQMGDSMVGLNKYAKSPLYKTELCRGWQDTGTCRYGVKCQFAHGLEELRIVPRHPKYKTVVCKTYATTGTCPYGRRCRFIHFNEPLYTPSRSPPLQSAGATAASVRNSRTASPTELGGGSMASSFRSASLLGKALPADAHANPDLQQLLHSWAQYNATGSAGGLSPVGLSQSSQRGTGGFMARMDLLQELLTNSQQQQQGVAEYVPSVGDPSSSSLSSVAERSATACQAVAGGPGQEPGQGGMVAGEVLDG